MSAASVEPPGASPARNRLILFAPDFTEVSTIARARAFLDHGGMLAVFAFRRGRYNPRFKAPWREVELGRTVDGKYVQRAFKLLRAAAVLWRNRRLLRQADIFYARNVDQLFLAWLSRLLLGARTRLVYEVLDIAPVFTRPGAIGGAMRLFESVLLRRIGFLVVSSPAFHRHYYADRQNYRGPTFLLENRLHPAAAAVIGTRPAQRPDEPALPRGRYRWTVGYFGLIRGQRTFDLMVRVAERCPDVLFYLRGIVTTVEARSFATAIATHENMVYGGPYVNPDDLRRLYEEIDLTWALDLEHADHNSRWLMPCRYYESGLLGVPLLAARDFEVGKRIESLGIGWTVDDPYEEALVRLLTELSREDHALASDRLASLPPSAFVAGEDVSRLCRAVSAPGDLPEADGASADWLTVESQDIHPPGRCRR